MNPHGPHGGHSQHPHGGPHGPHHYQPYPDLSSPSPVPHSPAADTSPFNGHPGTGGGGGGGGGAGGGGNTGGGNAHQLQLDSHHNPHMGGGPGHHHHHNHHHHHLNNNNNSTNNKNNSNTCAGCGGKIMERYLLHALDRYWHHNCLKCSCCGGQLADLGSSCFTKAGMILCKADYARLFGNTGACSACGQTIPASEFVMRVGGGPMGPMGGPGGPNTPNAQSPLHVFHLKCFSCTKCGSQLVPGDRYHLHGGNLVCEQDWHKLMKGGGAGGVPAGGPGTATGVRKGKVGRPRRSRD